MKDAALLEKLKMMVNDGSEFFEVRPDNPAIPGPKKIKKGVDPLSSKQWGMKDIGVTEAWKIAKQVRYVTVAVLDTGVDYTHEDLVNNLWRNSKEIVGNRIDDDKNGYVDDVIGWDFVSNDNKPFDYSLSPWEVIVIGGNPGHGTHCAGNIAATAGNSRGVYGVAPNVRIMPLRFLSERGSGTTADAIKAIHYAVKNGAKILSNSWGARGEDVDKQKENLALREAVQFAENSGVLFIAAAGNGRFGVGYDNDKDPMPTIPASYPYPSVISVAAVDSKNQLADFSNFGATSVDIAAPGVQVFSTTSDGKYSDVIVDMENIRATWDGTSMATPHVAGAAALYWGKYPNASALQVKAALINSATRLGSLNGKVVSGGKLNVKALLQ